MAANLGVYAAHHKAGRLIQELIKIFFVKLICRYWLLNSSYIELQALDFVGGIEALRLLAEQHECRICNSRWTIYEIRVF